MNDFKKKIIKELQILDTESGNSRTKPYTQSNSRSKNFRRPYQNNQIKQRVGRTKNRKIRAKQSNYRARLSQNNRYQSRQRRIRNGYARRNDRTNTRSGGSSLKNFKYKMKRNISNNVSINRRVGFNFPLPFLAPMERTKNNGQRVALTGSEYVTSLEAFSVSSETPHQAGDVLYVIPLNPIFFPGTRLLQLSKLFQHYKFKVVTFEYIPIVPSIQDGALLMFVSHDPNENNFITTDSDSRLRMALAHKGSHMFNVYTYGRCSLSMDEDTLKSYFVSESDEPRLSNQGQLFILAASQYNNDNQSLTLGQLIVHYDVELSARNVEDITPGNPTVYVTLNGTWNTYFAGVSQGAAIGLKSTGDVPSSSSKLYIFRVHSTLDLGGYPVLVDSTTGTDQTFLSQGSIWYGAAPVDLGLIYFYPSMDTAQQNDQAAATLSVNITGTLTTLCTISVEILDLSRY